jgi:hypothetical protein
MRASPAALSAGASERVRVCDGEAYVLAGGRPGRHLSTRMAGRILRRAVSEAAIDKPVCGMTLRHSYAVHSLQMGATIREVQEALGHSRLDTTLVYLRCMAAQGVPSPADQLPGVVAERLLDAWEPAEPVQMPFPADRQEGSGWVSFYRNLKTHMTGRFLALRRAVAGFPTGPPG